MAHRKRVRRFKTRFSKTSAASRGGLDGVTKKDFRAIADILCEHRATDRLVADVAGYFKSQNPRFSADRFFDAVKTCKKKG